MLDNEVSVDLTIVQTDIDKLFPTFIKFCRQDPNIMLNVLEAHESDDKWIRYKTFLITKSAIGYPFVKLEKIFNTFLEDINECGQRFIEELVFTKSFSINEMIVSELIECSERIAYFIGNTFYNEWFYYNPLINLFTCHNLKFYFS